MRTGGSLAMVQETENDDLEWDVKLTTLEGDDLKWVNWEEEDDDEGDGEAEAAGAFKLEEGPEWREGKSKRKDLNGEKENQRFSLMAGPVMKRTSEMVIQSPHLVQLSVRTWESH
ncbi:hypothetical protein DY000_02046691 [Brassica cretica]|uniref:Uncharacterized protein n=1 Tax=Brassica cretica TaxID=69181 RepID=A0ABQ7EU92_BRACR|nr:hypothetical protein DY000_02046691 [Brassica cretica]